MEEKKTPGWYPSESGAEQRYWDGEKWSGMTRANPGSKPAYDYESVVVAQKKKNLVLSIIGLILTIPLGVAILGIILTEIFGLGHWTLFEGTELGGIAYGALFLAVFASAFKNAVLTPINFCVRKKFVVAVLEAARNALIAENDQDSSLYDEASWAITKRYLSKRLVFNCMSWILGVVAAFLLHDTLMNSLGNPFADFLTIILMLVFSVLLVAVTKSIYRSELNPLPPEKRADIEGLIAFAESGYVQ